MNRRTPLAPRTMAQLAMPFDPPAPAVTTLESERLWEAILSLRRMGLRVYRVSRLQHRVGHRLLSAEKLIEHEARLAQERRARSWR